MKSTKIIQKNVKNTKKITPDNNIKNIKSKFAKSKTTNPPSNALIIKTVLIIILFMSLGIFIGVLSYMLYTMNTIQKNSVLLIQVINTSVEITEYRAGMNGDTDSLKFGKVPLGGGVIRYINVTSDEYDALVKIDISGDMAKFLTVDKNNFILSKGSSELVSFQLDVPYDAQLGRYSGLIKVTLSKK